MSAVDLITFAFKCAFVGGCLKCVSMLVSYILFWILKMFEEGGT